MEPIATTTLVDGRAARVFTAGEGGGTPVLLLHGGSIDHALLSWGPVIPRLAERRRVVAPDWPGYGGSEGLGRPHGVHDLVVWLRGLLDALDIARADLVGISMGGAAALGSALATPERVRGLVLVDAYGLQSRIAAHRLAYVATRVPGLARLAYAAMRRSRRLTRSAVGTMLRDRRRLDDALVDEAWAAVRLAHAGEGFRAFLRHEVGPSGLASCYVGRFAEVSAPTLVIHGRHDHLVPLACAERAARRIPDARLHVMETGHWPTREDPEGIARCIEGFLAAIDGPRTVQAGFSPEASG